jgi:hypothetical protein
MIKRRKDFFERRLEIKKIHDEPRLGINFSVQLYFDTVRMPVQTMASMRFRDVGQTVSRLEFEGLRYSHRIPTCL